MPDVAEEVVHPWSLQVNKTGAWKNVIAVYSSSMEDANTVTICTHDQELQAENADILSRRVRNQKLRMNTLLKLSAEKKRSSASEVKMKELTKQLVDERAKQKKGFVDRQAMEDIIAAKEIAENQIVVLNEKLQHVKLFLLLSFTCT